MTSTFDLRSAFSARLKERRSDIMRAWEVCIAADPRLVTGKVLPRLQLHDHLTALLEDFERRMNAATTIEPQSPDSASLGDAAAHGLHRWQQGFDLAELIRELGRLNETVVAEIASIGAEAAFANESQLLSEAQSTWASIFSDATSTSAAQFFKLQQIEAAGHVQDLEQALDALRSLDIERAALWQEAAHDLRGNLSVVSVVAAGLTAPTASEDKRSRFLTVLEQNVRALHAILEDVTSLARLEGGQEVRVLGDVDVSKLLGDMSSEMESLARQRGLAFQSDGPTPFMVQGDATKIRRIVQNLVLNALRYTRVGSVKVGWGPELGRESLRWVVRIDDTGPGLQLGPGSALAGAISVATEQAVDVAKAGLAGSVVHVSIDDADPSLKPDERGTATKPGEGIGLSIVKRLCTLLDATIEIESEPDRGTRFKILLPIRYD